MVEENQDHYCLPSRETNPTILTDKSWQDTTHSESQTLLELTKKWYLEFQDRYKSPTEQEAPTSPAYQQGLQSPVKSENEKEKLKWDSKMDDYDEESKKYY